MKKFLLSVFIILVGISVQAQECDEQVCAREHMFCEKGALSNMVTITNLRNIICKGNAFKVAFTCKFWSDCAKAGDRVNFDVSDAIYTQEGTLLIPAGSKVVATVIRIDKQRVPNKNARVYLNFECLIFPDGSAYPMSAKPLTKDGALKEDGWHTAGKLLAYTLGLGIVGAGGIGAPLIFAMNSYRWNDVGAILLGLVVLVLIVEWFSSKLRNALMRG